MQFLLVRSKNRVRQSGLLGWESEVFGTITHMNVVCVCVRAQNMSDCTEPAKTFIASPKKFKKRRHMNKTQTDSNRKGQTTTGKNGIGYTQEGSHLNNRVGNQRRLQECSRREVARQVTLNHPSGQLEKCLRQAWFLKNKTCTVPPVLRNQNLPQKTSCSLGHQCYGVSTQLLVCANSVLR